MSKRAFSSLCELPSASFVTTYGRNDPAVQGGAKLGIDQFKP